MGFMTDAPKSVHRMIAVLRDMGQYKYDTADVFRDAVDYAVAGLLVHGDPELAERLLKKYGDDYVQLGNFMRAWILTLDEQVTDDEQWFDALGMVYEYLASGSKRSWLGQFFTPPPVCDLMTGLTGGTGVKGKRVNDPASGSGRMLLSFNRYNPGNRLYGEDIDPMCARMTALNMALHGCQGQVCCMDSLAIDNWRFGFEVNPYHRLGAAPIPHLLPLTKEQCVSWKRKEVFVQEKVVRRVAEPVVVSAGKEIRQGQLSLF